MNMYIYLKRLFDIVISLVGMTVLIPLSIAAKVAFLLKGQNTTILALQVTSTLRIAGWQS